MSDPIKPSGRRYDRQFKENAVALVLAGRSQSEVSRDLGVSLWSLGEWVKKAKAGQAHRQPKLSRRKAPSSANGVSCARKINTCVSSATS